MAKPAKPRQREFKGISRRARQLLSQPEGATVDFKRDLTGIKGYLLVAFANSADGGALLIGVEEYTTAHGVQRGRVVGCPVDDDARLLVLNKASDCMPGVDVEIFVENLAKAPFLRVEIPPGRHKPYCTSKGEYTIRSDSRTRALYPAELLSMFMERESDLFLSRFRDAAQRLEQTLEDISGLLTEGLPGIGNRLQGLDEQLVQTATALEQLHTSNLNHADSLSELLRTHVNAIATVKNLSRTYVQSEVRHQQQMQNIEALLEQLLARQTKQD
ncbi:AlbA family DNA-binding domain-containing protein [Balneatrix alpica]|uniref:AlbA family DNA-binding domain-containing protein n=1 Tax=Balneatrix alpica TaxID=75684 RepID=UPI0027390542|nr:ATP-binding protein [Balneatrix alpica]